MIGRCHLRAIVAISAAYVYFLLFAQFGFLRLLETRFDTVGLKAVMAVMGVAGILASLATGHALGRVRASILLRAGFGGAAMTALLALVARGIAAHVALAASIGICTALVTVSLATDLRALVGGRAFALRIGVATGVAYWFCNVPAVFGGGPALQCVLSAFAAAIGALAVPTRTAGTLTSARAAAAPRSGEREASGFGFVAVVVAFLALIWLDSAAFSIIQREPALEAATWQGGDRGWILGALHALGAVAAGWLLDRGHRRALLAATFALFAVGFAVLGRGEPWPLVGSALYVVGISLYSVALVVEPSRARAGAVPARWRAALLFGVAGWIGSAVGIVTADGLERIPPGFVALAGVVLALALSFPPGPLVRRLARAHRITLAGGAAGVVVCAVAPLVMRPPAESAPDAVVRGRAVYLAEGCINCHSQYVRPNTRDVERWGPYHEQDPRERPVLIGNRRQGPDLMNVGLRRSDAWERLHLIDPRSIAPGSTMPSYGHLFGDGATRGEDLVEYLGSLGAGRLEERAVQIARWDASTAPRSRAHGARIFAQLCAPCHGAQGRGDGAAGRTLGQGGMDLLKDRLWLVGDREPEPQALARLVKFGAPEMTMPGHEMLSDEDVADVVAFVRSLRAARTASSEPIVARDHEGGG